MHVLLQVLCLSILFCKLNAELEVCVPNVLGSTSESIGNVISDIKTGIQEFGGSSEKSDTIYVDHVDIDIDHPAARIIGSMENLTISGLSEITVCFMDHFSILNVQGPFDLFYIHAPNLSVTGEYNITGNVGQIFDIFGNGKFRVHLQNFFVEAKNVTGNMTADDRICFSVNVNVSLESLGNDTYFNGLMTPELEEIFNKAIRALAPECVDIIWSELKEQVDGPLQKWIEQIEEEIFKNGGIQNMLKMLSLSRHYEFDSSFKLSVFPICYGPK